MGKQLSFSARVCMRAARDYRPSTDYKTTATSRGAYGALSPLAINVQSEITSDPSVV